ncbi:hypothetical protein AVEN_92688-1 [Araneus ventricosus]|uniref:Uncharacterized protein n=1 Tax=Araneus ventricosus TaxID=182803 RepID=A0A4Y2SUV6_ARAVE|nr:hypothetical protein AVEN_92688-1 [Araneus ventricosus]
MGNYMHYMWHAHVCPDHRTSTSVRGRGGIVVRSRPRDRRVAGSTPDSTEDPPCMGPVVRYVIRSGQTSSGWWGAEVWRVVLVI